MKTHLLRRGGLLAAVVASALLVSAGAASAAPGDGSAYGVNVDVTLLGSPAVHVGPLAAASTKGPTSSTLARVDIPGILNAGVINAEAKRDNSSGAVLAKASIADVKLTLLREALGKADIKLIEAKCLATQQGVKGSSRLVDVDLGRLGKAPVDPAANSKIEVRLGNLNIATIILNEQIPHSDGSLTVNAVHVKLLGGVLNQLASGDVILSSATCGPAALPIPLASGAGMWIAFGLLGAIAVPVGMRFVRKRRPTTAV